MKQLLCLLSICIMTGLGCASLKPVVLNKTFNIESSSSKNIKDTSKGKVKKGEELDLYYKNEYVGSMKWSDYELIQESAKEHLKELTAEQKKRVKVQLTDSPWRIEIDQKYVTDAYIIWINEDGSELKKIKLQISLERKDNNTFTCDQIKIIAGVFGGVAGAALISFIVALIILL